MLTDVIAAMESLRIDVDTECEYQDKSGVLRDKYERANEMLDDCLKIVRAYYKDEVSKAYGVDDFACKEW